MKHPDQRSSTPPRSAHRLARLKAAGRTGPTLLLLGLLPAVCVLWQATEVSTSRAGAANDTANLTPSQKVLARIPNDPTVLINVTGRDMPSSPDILNLGKRSTKALQRCLSDNVDSAIRRTCANVLRALGDRSALPTLQAALEDWEADVRFQVVWALESMPDPSSVPPLIKLYRRKDEQAYVRRAIIDALGAMSDQRAVRLLRSELHRKPKKGETDVRPSLFDALWASRHLMARTTLISDVRRALGSDNNSLVLSATEACAELRARQLVAGLVPLMEHKWPDVRNKAVYALGRIGDKTATKALLKHLPKVREARMLNNIAFALERLDSKAFYRSIQKVIEHKQAIIRLNAAFVLGDVKHAEGLPLLEKALDDPSDYVKSSAIVALGKLAIKPEQAKQAIAALGRFVDEPNLSVRQEAIYALDKLSGGKKQNLIYDQLYDKLRADPKDRYKYRSIIRRAAIALGKKGDSRVSDYLMACFERYNCAVADVAPFVKTRPGRTAGRVLLAWAQGRMESTDLVGALQPTGTLPVATSTLEAAWAGGHDFTTRRAIDLLGEVGDKSALSLLQQRSNAKNVWVRNHAWTALARLGHVPATGQLDRQFDSLPASWLPHFVRVVERIKEPAIRNEITPALAKREQSQDIPVALAAAAVHLAWDPDQAIFRFLDALASPRGYERDLAEDYLLKNKSKKVTWLLRRALARESRQFTKDRLRLILDEKS